MLAIVVHFEAKPDKIDAFKDQAAIDAHRATPYMAETGKIIPDLILKRDLTIFDLVAGGKPKR